MLLIIFARRTCFTKFSPAGSHPKDNERTSLCINLFFNGFIMRSRPEMGVNHNIIIGPSSNTRLEADIKVIKVTSIHARGSQRRWLNQTLQRCGECKLLSSQRVCTFCVPTLAFINNWFTHPLASSSYQLARERMKAQKLSAVSHFTLRHEKFIFNFLSSCVDNSQKRTKKAEARAYAWKKDFLCCKCTQASTKTNCFVRPTVKTEQFCISRDKLFFPYPPAFTKLVINKTKFSTYFVRRKVSRRNIQLPAINHE